MSAKKRTVNRAFTLVELLVVLAIITILLAIALPAFKAMAESQQRTASEGRLGSAMAIARDAAILGGEDADVGAVFVYEMGGPMRIIACRKVGKLVVPASRGEFEIFVPIDTIEPVTLPSGWTVRGYANPAMMTPSTAAGSPQWYTDASSVYPAGQPAWVFPETGFYDHTSLNDGENRQTFMVRFEGGTGKLVGATTQSALVYLPRPSDVGRSNNPTDYRLRADLTDDLRGLAVTLLNDPTVPYATRQQLIGPNSSDVVLTRPVQVLALADESDIANQLGVRLDRNSDSLYQATDAEVTAGLTLSPKLVPSSSALSGVEIGRVIESFASASGATEDRRSDQDVRLYTIDRYYGTLQLLPVPVIQTP